MNISHGKAEEARQMTGLLSSNKLYSAATWLLDLVFPPRCNHCGRVDERFCTVCQQQLQQEPIEIHDMMLDSGVTVFSTGIHNGVLQSAVQALKYRQTRVLAPLLADRLLHIITEQNWTIDMIIPVPMHIERLRQRRYNQANDLSSALAARLALPNRLDVLHRNRATRSQVGLNRAERLTNVVGAFHADSEYLAGQRIVLIDDVRTTGATLHACTHALQEAGAIPIAALTVSAAE